MLLVLSGCAGGSAPEARQGGTREATRGAVLPERQATFTVREFGPKTPTAGPTATAAIVVEEIRLTNQVGGGGEPIGSYASFPTDGGTLYVAARLHGLREGQQVVAQLATPDRRAEDGKMTYGSFVREATVEVERDEAVAWVAVPLALDGGLSPGPYDAFLSVDGRQVYSIALELTGPGTGPRQLG